MSKAYLDTNVLLDVAIPERPGHVDALRLLANPPAQLGVSAGSLKDFYYIARRCGLADDVCRGYIRVFLDRADILADDRSTCAMALESDEPDYEDATKAVAAQMWGADFVVSRDIEAFIRIGIPKTDAAGLFARLS